jgi:hypothetical protein
MSASDVQRPDTTLLDERIKRELDRRGVGGGDGGDDLGARVSTLETAIARIDATLLRMESKIDQLPKATEVAELKGRVSQLPTVWQLFGLVIAIFGLAFALLRFGVPQ